MAHDWDPDLDAVSSNIFQRPSPTLARVNASASASSTTIRLLISPCARCRSQLSAKT